MPIGFFFSPHERVRRLRALLSQNDSLTTAHLQEIHNDVVVPSAARLRNALLAALTQETFQSWPDE